MATRNFTASIDAYVRQENPTTNYGTGVYAFVGKEGGGNTVNRALFKFNNDFTSVASVTSAILWVRSDDVWVGSSPTFTIQRVTATWTETGVTWNTIPASTATNQVTPCTTDGGSAGFNKWYSYNITGIVTDWFNGSTNYGIKLFSTNEASVSYSTEFSTRESAYDPYIVLTYVNNVVPNAPTLNSPIGGALVAAQNPTLNFTPTDPDGDTMTAYTYQVDNNSDFSSTLESTEVTGSFASGVAVNRVVTSTLSRGTTYYWRVKAKDAVGYGAYSAGQSFKIGVLPTTSVTTPVAGHTARLWYTAGTSTNPKIAAYWSYSCGDGHAQSHYRVYIYADPVGAALYDSGWVAGTATNLSTTYAVVKDTKYHVSVQVRCSLALDSLESTKNITRVRWGRASYYFDGTTTPLTLSAANSQTVGANQALVLEYAVSATTAEPGTWYSTVAAAGLNRYFWHRVTMWGYASATPTSPSLNSLTWSYSNTAIAADNWTLATGGTIDTGAYVYGTQSLKHATNGAAQRSYQLVPVPPDRSIILSGRMKISGNPGAKLRILSSDGSTELASVLAPTATTDWARYVTPVINTGSDSELRVEAYSSAAASNTVWFDALKLEESSVATMWTPGFVSGGVTVDAGGLGVNAQKGGVLRLVGSAGGARNIVGLGASGLVFGGDTELYSDVANEIKTSDAVRVDGGLQLGTATASGSSTGMRFGADVFLGRHAANVLGTEAGDSIVVGAIGGGVTQTGIHLRQDGSIDIRANAGTPYIDFSNDLAADFDARLVLSADDTLDLSGAGLDVLAGGVALNGTKLSRYVALVGYQYIISAGTYTAGDSAVQTTGEITLVPTTGVTAVACHILARSSTANAGNIIHGLDYAGATTADQVIAGYAGSVAAFYQDAFGILVPGGTNGRQVKYWRSWGAGTVTWYMAIVGYWTNA